MSLVDTPFPRAGFSPVLMNENALVLAEALASVDGEAFGTLRLAEIQRRLEAAGDFAILQLETTFTTLDPLEDWRIELNGQGLRLAEVDRIYLTPIEKTSTRDRVIYGAPRILPAGVHRFQWSYAWNPPSDDVDDPDAVHLVAPRVLGEFRVSGGQLGAWPTTVDLEDLTVLGELSGRVRLMRSVVRPGGDARLLTPPEVLRVLWNETDSPPGAPTVAASGSVAFELEGPLPARLGDVRWELP